MACESMVDKLVELKPIIPMYFDHNKTKAKYWGDLPIYGYIQEMRRSTILQVCSDYKPDRQTIANS